MSDYEPIFWTDEKDGQQVEVGWRPSTQELMVNRKPVVTRSIFSFTRAQAIGALITVLSAGLGGFYALLQIIDWFKG